MTREQFLQGILARSEAVVRDAPMEERLERLNDAAFVLGQLAGSGFVERENAVVQLLKIGVDCGMDRSAALGAIDLGLAEGKKHPRCPDGVEQ